MIIVLNGPLGIGKSTLAETLAETVDGCVMLDGDQLTAVNPPARDEIEHLHSTVSLLVEHHRKFGYEHAVVNHLWTAAHELADLRRRLVELDPNAVVHCFLLTLDEDENTRRIERRARARALDELDFERRTMIDERRALEASTDLGVPFDVTAPPAELVARMLRIVGLA